MAATLKTMIITNFFFLRSKAKKNQNKIIHFKINFTNDNTIYVIYDFYQTTHNEYIMK